MMKFNDFAEEVIFRLVVLFFPVLLLIYYNLKIIVLIFPSLNQIEHEV